MRIDEPGIPLLMILDISNIQGSQNGVILTRQFLSLSSLIKATEHFTDKKKTTTEYLMTLAHDVDIPI